MRNIQIQNRQLATAIEAATEAGDHAASMKQTADSEVKPDTSIVTTADREAETIVRTHLTDASTLPILGEEHGGDMTGEDTYWVIDPIDGTWNFTNHQPFYGTAIALIENNEPTIGVWYMPELDRLFYAVAGNGAYCGDTQLHISPDTDLSDAYPIVSGYGSEQFHPAIATHTFPRGQRLGSAVMAEAWVASGWCDIGILGAVKPWDVAAGTVLIREAGGIVKHVQTEVNDWSAVSNGHLILGNETVADSLLSALTPADIQTIIGTEYGT